MIISNLKNGIYDAYNIEPGSPKIPKSINLIKNILSNFNDSWSSDIHLIKSYSQNQISNSIETEINNVINSLFPLFNSSAGGAIIEKQYWLFAPGAEAKDWNEFYEKGIMAISYSFRHDLKMFKTQKDLYNKYDDLTNSTGKMNTKRALLDISQTIKKGDVVIVKKGNHECLGYGLVSSDYYYSESGNYPHQRQVDWKSNGVWQIDNHNLPLKTLTNITEYTDFVNDLKNAIGMNTSTENIITKFSFNS